MEKGILGVAYSLLIRSCGMRSDEQPGRRGSRPDMIGHQCTQVPAERTLRHNLQQFEAVGIAIWQRSKDRLWIPLLWLVGIPVSTLILLTMLFWAYGVED